MKQHVRISQKAMHTKPIVAIDLMKFHAARDIIELSADHVVDADHAMAVGEHGIGQVTAEKPGNPGNEDFAHNGR